MPERQPIRPQRLAGVQRSSSIVGLATTGLAGCCACATSGRGDAAPPTRVRKSRRLMQSPKGEAGMATPNLLGARNRQDDRIFSVVLRLRAPSLRPLRFHFLGNFLLLVVVVHSICHLL
jgi:hypothetical protein